MKKLRSYAIIGLKVTESQLKTRIEFQEWVIKGYSKKHNLTIDEAYLYLIEIMESENNLFA